MTRLVTLLVFAGIALAARGGEDPLRDPTHAFWSQPAPLSFRAVFETSVGDFVVECSRELAPRGVDRFFNLIRSGFFDDSRFFRVRAGYIAQFGLPGDPILAAIWKDERLPDDPPRASNLAGSFAYAMTGPDTRTTQIYFNLTDNTHLDGQGFAPLGRVVEGMDVVLGLYAGYGEEAGGGMRRGRQGRILSEGNAHLDAAFPKLTRLRRARIVGSQAP